MRTQKLAALQRALDSLSEALLEAIEAATENREGGPEPLLSIEQACEIIGCKRSFIYSELAAGRLSSLKLGRRRLIPGSAIDAYIREGHEA